MVRVSELLSKHCRDVQSHGTIVDTFLELVQSSCVCQYTQDVPGKRLLPSIHNIHNSFLRFPSNSCFFRKSFVCGKAAIKNTYFPGDKMITLTTTLVPLSPFIFIQWITHFYNLIFFPNTGCLQENARIKMKKFQPNACKSYQVDINILLVINQTWISALTQDQRTRS